MSQRRVLSLARLIRKALEPIAVREAEDDLQGFCGRAAAQLLIAAQAEGIYSVEAHMNDDHVFNIYRGRTGSLLIDITATQFGIKDKVFVRRCVGRRRKFHRTVIVTADPTQVDFLFLDELRADRRRVLRLLRGKKAGRRGQSCPNLTM